ncbi:hypothetical protein ACUODJ_61405, partial [Escherichia sp. HC-CC]
LHRRQPEDKHPALHHKAFLPHQRVTTEGKGMIDDIKRIDSMINALRNMKQDIKRQQKLSEINSLDLSPKQAQ